MASFTGTAEEFHRFIGPRIRNVIQARTKRHKRTLAACQECGAAGELEAAHRQGRGRRSVIDTILANRDAGAVIKVADVAALERQILSAHEPFEEYFLFLCRACHVRYDAKPAPPPATPATPSGRPGKRRP